MGKEILATCSCGRAITRDEWRQARESGQAKIQILPTESYDLELIPCPACWSHRSIQIPNLHRSVMLACMPGVAVLR
jgi:hypothetical protein